MTLIALVPMKGHSERVPGKNLRPIAGRPLFHWVVESLLTARNVDEVMVDTDSDEIESAVREVFSEVTIHRRPEHLRGDLVPMHDIVADVARDVVYDYVLQTHSTNPLLRPETVDRAITALVESPDRDSLMSVTAWKSRFFFPDGTPVNHDPAVLVRTQDLPPLLEENSNIYISTRDLIVATGLRVGKNPLLFEVDADEAVDIDEELDFRIAEFLLTGRHD